MEYMSHIWDIYPYVTQGIYIFIHTYIYMHTVENGSIHEAEKRKWWRKQNKLERSESGGFEQNIFIYEILKQ